MYVPAAFIPTKENYLTIRTICPGSRWRAVTSGGACFVSQLECDHHTPKPSLLKSTATPPPTITYTIFIYLILGGEGMGLLTPKR